MEYSGQNTMRGSGLKDPNVRLRFLVIVFMGVIAFGAVMYWRHVTLISAEYIDLQIPKQKVDPGATFRSPNYQIEVEDSSPTIN